MGELYVGNNGRGSECCRLWPSLMFKRGVVTESCDKDVMKCLYELVEVVGDQNYHHSVLRLGTDVVLGNNYRSC